MIRVNLGEARAHLSQIVDAALRGERVVLCRRNVEIVEIRPLPPTPVKQRPVGIDSGMEIPDSFFEAILDEELRKGEVSGD